MAPTKDRGRRAAGRAADHPTFRIELVPGGDGVRVTCLPCSGLGLSPRADHEPWLCKTCAGRGRLVLAPDDPRSATGVAM